jgi:hypothetical protein
MLLQKNLGQKCRFTDECNLYRGAGIPDSMNLNLWRNVFCYRGIKGWSNCQKFNEFEEEGIKESKKTI